MLFKTKAAGLRNGKEAPVTEPDIEEYFLYTPKKQYPSGTFSGAGGKKDSVKIAKDAVAYCSSGLVDRNKGTVFLICIKQSKHSINLE